MLQPGSKIGKYQIERVLGRGGMGVVFLAFDGMLQRHVAVKVLTPQAADTPSPQLLREARSASALNHPNICAVYDAGEAEGLAFIAMEFVDGRPLSDAVMPHGLPVEQAVKLAIEAADGLAHAHGRGIVHRDLKAANTILTPTGHLKIVDFGLARHRAPIDGEGTADTATSIGLAAGTPYAMAPEQIRGDRGDERTDIWSFGVLLYEMLSGGRPFNGSSVDVFVSILRDPPRSLPSAIPSALCDIVLKCLEKNPENRFAGASDVRVALEAAASNVSWHSATRSATPSDRPLPLPPVVTAVAGPLVGRDAELDRLDSAWRVALSGTRSLVFLGGEPGVGKTRCALEFARRVAHDGGVVLFGRCEEEALVPYQPFVEALGWFVRVAPDGELHRALAAADGGAELAPLLIDLQHRVPTVASPTSGEGQRYRLFETIDALLSAVADLYPTLLIVDDAQWADKPTLLLWRHIARSSRAGRLCVVSTYRESDVGKTHPLANLLADLRRDRAVLRLSLGGLPETAVGALMQTLAGDVPPALVQLMTESTAGNPFFVTEMVRHLSETGSLQRARLSGSLPEGVKEVIGRRLSRLSDVCNRVLSLGAVVGRQFDADLLAAVAGLPEDQVFDAVDEAVRARLVHESDGVGRFTFVHALVRETLYGDLTAIRRARLHRQVAEALEQRTRGKPMVPLGDLAYHYVQSTASDVVDKAIEYATRAGDHARDLLAYEEAARFYEMALRVAASLEDGSAKDTRLVDLHTRRADAFAAIGQWADQIQEAREALLHLGPDFADRRAELVLTMADASFYLLDIPTVQGHAAEALRLGEQLQRADIAADAIGWLARCRQASGDLRGAIELDRTAFARGRGRRGVAEKHGSLSLYLAGHSDAAVSLAAEAAAQSHGSRDIEFITYALSHYGLALGDVGRYREATDVFGRLREHGRKYGIKGPLARGITMSGGFRLDVFDLVEAEAIAFEARELAQQLAFAPSLVSASIDLLFVFARQQEPGKAEHLLEEATGAAASTPGWHEWLWKLRLVQARAELALASGLIDDAVGHATDALAQARGVGRPKYEALACWTRAQARHQRHDVKQAISDARSGEAAARRTGNPALLLTLLDTLITLDGSDELLTEARGLCARIARELPDPIAVARFNDSAVVQRIRRGRL